MLDSVAVSRPLTGFHELCSSPDLPPTLQLTLWPPDLGVPALSLAFCSSLYNPFMPYNFPHRIGPIPGQWVTFSAAFPSSVSFTLTPHPATNISVINPEWALGCPTCPTVSRTPPPHPMIFHHQLKSNTTEAKPSYPPLDCFYLHIHLFIVHTWASCSWRSSARIWVAADCISCVILGFPRCYRQEWWRHLWLVPAFQSP